MATTSVPLDLMAAGTLAAMVEFAAWVGMTVEGMGGDVVVVVEAGALVVVVVDVLELLEQAAASRATVPRASATPAFFIPRFDERTRAPPSRSSEATSVPRPGA